MIPSNMLYQFLKLIIFKFLSPSSRIYDIYYHIMSQLHITKGHTQMSSIRYCLSLPLLLLHLFLLPFLFILDLSRNLSLQMTFIEIYLTMATSMIYIWNHLLLMITTQITSSLLLHLLDYISCQPSGVSILRVLISP